MRSTRKRSGSSERLPYTLFNSRQFMDRRKRVPVQGAKRVINFMPKKKKINLGKVLASLNTICPKCKYSIPSSERQHADTEHILCPKCGEHFAPVASPSSMVRTHFPPGQEPTILTSISEQCVDGKCESCPGIFKRDDHAGESIFCTHSCHKKPRSVQ